MDRLLTVDDVARILQVCRRTAYSIMHQMACLQSPMRVTEAALKGWIWEHTALPQEKTGQGRGKTKDRWRPVKMPLAADDYRIPRRRA